MIRAEHLTKRYQDHVILEDVFFRAERGKITMITGESGSGKSTLLNILSGLESNYEGSVFFEDCLLKGISSSKRIHLFRNQFSYLLQNYGLIQDETVFNNMKLALYFERSKNKKEEMIKALNQVGLHEQILKRKTFLLSGGEQQRIALARLLLKPSKVIFADEPTGNLDINNASMVFQTLQHLSQRNRTVILVTHDERMKSYADRIYEIKDRKIL